MTLPLPMATAALFEINRHLERAGIRNATNIRSLFANQHMLAVYYVIERLADSYDEEGNMVLNQNTYDFVIANWEIFSNHEFLDLLQEQHPIGVTLGEYELREYADDRPLARQNDDSERRVEQPLMGRQGTHTTSVHQSVSASAKRLHHLYAESVLNRRFQYDITLSRSSIAKLVKSYDKKLVGAQNDETITSEVIESVNKLKKSTLADPVSGVKLADLFDLCIQAIWDSERCREGVTEEVAISCLYAALYEIAREYSMNDEGVDMGYRGSMRACEGGAFNKLIEAMAKIHTQCEVNFITPATAALKLPFVVKSCLLEQIQRNEHIDISFLKNEGMGDIWDQIKSQVLERMEHEFGSIYPKVGDQTNETLLALVDAGQDIDLSFLDHKMYEENRDRGNICGSEEDLHHVYA